MAARAEALLLEQTVELPRAIAARDPWVADHILGCVEEIRPAGADLHRVTIAQPLATTAGDPAQLLSVLFGNCSLQPDVRPRRRGAARRGLRLAAGPARGRRRAARAHRRDAAVRCWPPRSSRWGSSPPSSRRLRHLRAGGDRSDQGRPRPRRSSVLPVRGPRRGVPRRGGGRGERHRPPRSFGQSRNGGRPAYRRGRPLPQKQRRDRHLNSGHQRANAYAIRLVGDDHEPKRFRTWSPKAIALIGKLPATLESRAIHIELRRKTAGEEVRPLRADQLDHLLPLCRQAARWAEDNASLLRNLDPDMPATLSGRAADNWRPLIAIADMAGGESATRARRIAEELGGNRGEQTASVKLLEDIQRIFADEGTDRIPSQELATKLAKMEDRPWVEWRNDKPMTPPQVAKLLNQFKVRPDTIRMASGTAKGYMLKDFADAFARYASSQSVTPEQVNKINGLSSNQSVTRGGDVTDKNCQKSNDFKGCYGVTDENVLPGQKGQCADCGEGERLGDEMLEAYTGGCKSWLHRSCAEARAGPLCRRRDAGGDGMGGLVFAGRARISPERGD